MERKNNGLIAMVVILTILVLGLGGYIVYDKFMEDKKDANNEKENEIRKETEDEELKNVNYAEVNKQLNKYFGGSAYIPIMDIEDLATSADKRILFTTFVIGEDQEYKETEDDYPQSIFYVTKVFFKEKYQSIYGTNYSFDEDYKNLEEHAILFEDIKRLGNDSYGWNSSYGINPATGTLEATNLEKENDKYILSGKFILEDRSSEKTETKEESFKIIYTKENENRYLVDITLE